mmetsp:Transcript_146758/g.471092  ORF Transcript_146758/g.471092 Transcript_146758/m.471092 type:complete len:518 (-) Transcript_146758:802-2355(-)
MANIRALIELVQAFERATDEGRYDRAGVLVRLVPGGRREGGLEGGAAHRFLLAVRVHELDIDDDIALVGDIGDLVLAVVLVVELEGEVLEEHLAVAERTLLLHRDDKVLAAALAVVAILVSGLDHELRHLVRLLLQLHARAVAQRLLRDGVQEERIRRRGRREVAHTDLHPHDASLRADGRHHAGRGHDDSFVVDDLALSCGHELARRPLNNDHAVGRREADTANRHLHVTCDRSQRRLGAQDCVRRADNGRYVDLPHVVQPLVRPAPEDDQTGFLGIVAHGRMLAGLRPVLVVRLHLQLRLVPLVLISEVQHADARVEDAAGATLAVHVGGAAEDEDAPGGDGLDELQAAVPPRDAPREVDIGPILVLDVEHEQIIEDAVMVPAAKYVHTGILGEGSMACTRCGRIALAGELLPPGIVQVQHPSVVPGTALVPGASVPTKQYDGALAKARGVVRARRRHGRFVHACVVLDRLRDHGDELLVEDLIVGRHKGTAHEAAAWPHLHRVVLASSAGSLQH